MDYEENASLLDGTMFSVVWQIDTFVSVPWSNNCLNVRKWRGSESITIKLFMLVDVQLSVRIHHSKCGFGERIHKVEHNIVKAPNKYYTKKI